MSQKRCLQILAGYCLACQKRTVPSGSQLWTQHSANPDTFTFSGAVEDGGTITIGAGGVSATANIEIAAAEGANPGHELPTGALTIVDVSNHATYGSWGVGLEDAAGNIVALGAIGTGGAAADTAADLVTDWVDVNDTTNSLLNHTPNAAFGLGDTINVTGEGIAVSSQADAGAAITTIDAAITMVSAERSKLGHCKTGWSILSVT